MRKKARKIRQASIGKGRDRVCLYLPKTLGPINIPRQANSETRSIHCDKRQKSSPTSTSSLHIRFEMNSKIPSPPLSLARPNIVRTIKPQSRSSSRRSRPRKLTSTMPARNTSRISVATTQLIANPQAEAGCFSGWLTEPILIVDSTLAATKSQPSRPWTPSTTHRHFSKNVLQ